MRISGQVLVEFYKLEENYVAIGRFVLSTVPALRLRELGSVSLWPLRAPRAQGHRPMPSSGSAGPMPEDIVADQELMVGDEGMRDESTPDDEEDLHDSLSEQLEHILEEAGVLLEPVEVVQPPEQGIEGRPIVANVAPLADIPPVPPVGRRNSQLSAPEDGSVRVMRSAAEITYIVPGGSISYYTSKGAFQAVCDAPGHGRCVLTRTAKAKKIGLAGEDLGGRPVGFLAAWLARGVHCSTKEEHWAPDNLQQSQEVRATIRDQIRQTDGGVALLQWERPRGPEEPDEPTTLEGLL